LRKRRRNYLACNT